VESVLVSTDEAPLINHGPTYSSDSLSPSFTGREGGEGLPQQILWMRVRGESPHPEASLPT